jgi:hypothetical protein
LWPKPAFVVVTETAGKSGSIPDHVVRWLHNSREISDFKIIDLKVGQQQNVPVDGLREFDGAGFPESDSMYAD